MISFVPLLLSIQIQVIGLEVGAASYCPHTGPGFQVGVFHSHNISEIFRISSGISYWTKRYREREGILERNCLFSDLVLYEDGLITGRLSERLTAGAGAGLSVHLLKNDACERVDYGPLIVTNYRTTTLNRVGFGIRLMADVKIRSGILALRAGYTTLLMGSGEENLFYQRGNIRIFAMALGIGWQITGW
jgi:hypothetical protein